MSTLLLWIYFWQLRTKHIVGAVELWTPPSSHTLAREAVQHPKTFWKDQTQPVSLFSQEIRVRSYPGKPGPLCAHTSLTGKKYCSRISVIENHGIWQAPLPKNTRLTSIRRRIWLSSGPSDHPFRVTAGESSLPHHEGEPDPAALLVPRVVKSTWETGNP